MNKHKVMCFMTKREKTLFKKYWKDYRYFWSCYLNRQTVIDVIRYERVCMSRVALQYFLDWVRVNRMYDKLGVKDL